MIYTHTEKFLLHSQTTKALAPLLQILPTEYAKHIDIRYHFNQNCLQNNSILIDYITTALQAAHILTKVLSPILHEQNINLFGFHTSQLSSYSTRLKECWI